MIDLYYISATLVFYFEIVDSTPNPILLYLDFICNNKLLFLEIHQKHITYAWVILYIQTAQTLTYFQQPIIQLYKKQGLQTLNVFCV